MTNRPWTRRHLVQGLSLFGATAAGLPALPAFARDQDDYKALVCVILKGGLDNFDCVIPTDVDGYRSWSQQRGSLLEQYRAAGHKTRLRDALAPLPGSSAKGYALAPELAPLADLYGRGRLAMVANVGPLIAPTNRTTLEGDRALRPPRIASHSDQYAMWSTLNLEGANVGWGGQFLDRMNDTSVFSSVSFRGVEAFGQGQDVHQVALSEPKVAEIPGLEADLGVGIDRLDEILRDHYRAQGVKHTDALMADLARSQDRGLRQAAFIRDVIRYEKSSRDVAIKDNLLSEQLAAVAAMIATRSLHKTPRQVFVVSLPGFDTHRNAARSLPKLQRQVAEALARFDAVMEARGDGANVTSFTISDFGRTLAANATGTDHGWGGHHFVLGGAVKGGRVVGSLPPPTKDHDQAWANRGGLIPSLSIEQYGAALGSWFGVADSDLAEVFPNLRRFDAGQVDILSS